MKQPVRGRGGQIIVDKKLNVTEVLVVPVIDDLVNLPQGAIALGVNGLVVKDRNDEIVDVGANVDIGPKATIAVNTFKLDATYFADTVFFFRWGTKTATLTTKAVPDNSGTQIYIGPFTPTPSAYLLPQFKANPILSEDFIITASGDRELMFTAKATGPEYNFIQANAGFNIVKGYLGGLEGMVGEDEKDLLRAGLAPVYKPPYARITSTLTDEFIQGGQRIHAPLEFTFHKEDAGDFTHAVIYRDGYDTAIVYPDNSKDEIIIGFGAGTTGGAGGETVMVSTFEQMSAAVRTEGPLIIHVNGTLRGSGLLYIKSNKTIIGMPDSKIIGFGLMMFGVTNVIIRYITIEKLVTFSNIIIKEGTTNVWVDHCELSSDTDHGWEYYDGLLDITKKASYVTVSNCILRDNHHAFLIGGGFESVSDTGFLKVTIYNCLFKNLIERAPSVRFGEVHVFNCHTIGSANYAIGSSVGANVRLDNNVYEDCNTPVITKFRQWDSGFVTGVDTNIYTRCGVNVLTTPAASWVPPYEFEAIPAANVKEMVALKAGPDGRKIQYAQPFSLDVMPNDNKLVWTATFHYQDGPVKLDVFGKPYQIGQILASSISTNKLIYNPHLIVCYGPVLDNPTQSSHILALPYNRLDNANDEFSFETGTILKKQAFVVPPTKELVSVTCQGADITKEYLLINPNIPVKNAANSNVEGYKLYIRTMGIPYFASREHTITFKPKN